MIFFFILFFVFFALRLDSKRKDKVIHVCFNSFGLEFELSLWVFWIFVICFLLPSTRILLNFLERMTVQSELLTLTKLIFWKDEFATRSNIREIVNRNPQIVNWNFHQEECTNQYWVISSLFKLLTLWSAKN